MKMGDAKEYTSTRFVVPGQYYAPPPAPDGWVPEADCPFIEPDFVCDAMFIHFYEYCESHAFLISRKKRKDRENEREKRIEKSVEERAVYLVDLKKYKTNYAAWREVEWDVEYNRLMNARLDFINHYQGDPDA